MLISDYILELHWDRLIPACSEQELHPNDFRELNERLGVDIIWEGRILPKHDFNHFVALLDQFLNQVDEYISHPGRVKLGKGTLTS